MLRTLGRGGFGTVYLAAQSGDGGFAQKVAVKVLNLEDERTTPEQRRYRSDFERRLRDEARLLGSITHHAVVRAQDLLWLAGAWAVVMEYAEGASLHELAEARVAVPAGLALEITAEVASALDACWRQEGLDGRPLRLLHRDIKPANVLITSEGAVKVLDFGIAKAELPGREALTSSVAYGSHGYAPLEQLRGDAHANTDVYALGVTLFELLVGERFTRGLLSERQHLKRLREGLAALGPEVPPEVGDLVTRMTAYEAEERPCAADVVREARALARALHREDREDWARRVVPPVLAAREEVKGGFPTGTVLEEGDAGASSPPPAASPSETTFEVHRAPPRTGASRPSDGPTSSSVVWIGAGVGLSGAAVVAVLGIGLAVWAFTRPDPEAPAIHDPVPVAADLAGAAASGQAEDGPPGRELEASKPEESGVVAAPRPSRVARPLPIAPISPAISPAVSPAVSPAASPTSLPVTIEVALTGNADGARLVGLASYALPGRAAPGDYSVRATFPGVGEVVAGPVTLPPRGPVTVDCQRTFKRCQVK